MVGLTSCNGLAGEGQVKRTALGKNDDLGLGR